MLALILDTIREYRKYTRNGREIMRYLNMPKHARATHDKIAAWGYKRGSKRAGYLRRW